MGLLETARDVKSGKMKLSDVPEGSRRHVQRLLPVAGEAPKVAPRTVIERGVPLRRVRST